MRMRILAALLYMLFFGISSYAEGTRETAPNGGIIIQGNVTNDIAALLLNDTRFNTFASYDNPDSNRRMYINIQDPMTECIYLGFSFAHDALDASLTPLEFEYRIKDPNGNVVFGPVFTTQATANIQDWSQANIGPQQLFGAGGYDAVQVTSTQLTSQGWTGEGDYYIEFASPSTPNGFLIDYWDITVADCSVAPVLEKKGRLWAFSWALWAVNDFGFPNRPFNGAFYVCAPDPDNPDAAFITRIDFNGAGFRPAAFNVAFNSFGVMNTGNIVEDRRSVENMNLTQQEYAIFLNDPVDICETAEPGNIDLLGVGTCDLNSYCIEFQASKKGQVDLILDFDGQDGVFTPGTADLMIARSVHEEEVGVSSCIEWDGLDGLGNPIPQNAASSIPVILAFAQGVYHFPMYDAEFMINGFSIEAIRPVGDQPLLYYDDSQLSMVSGSGEPAVQLMGCVLPCHRWTNFVNNSVVGFGNLSTINSWWFSKLIMQQEVFFFPGTYECHIIGESEICEGDLSTLSLMTNILPDGIEVVDISNIDWTGPTIIGANDVETVTIGGPGVYTCDIVWSGRANDTCTTRCSLEVTQKASSSAEIDTLIFLGDEMIDINGEIISEPGIYTQFLTASNGCDSTLTIFVRAIQSVIYYDVDACRSFNSNGTNFDYTEFVAAFPQPLECATIEASIVSRENPTVHAHSCTPGVNSSPAMCVSSLESCDYAPGDEKSVVFELTVFPDFDTAVAITSLSFFEKAPETFDWISGNSGPNAYPQFYGIRVLKDDQEIFSQSGLETTQDWTEELFDFSDFTEFVIDQQAVFRFELLGYCTFDNDAPVMAWDIDEIEVKAVCAPTSAVGHEIKGSVVSSNGSTLENVSLHVHLDENEMFSASSDEHGVFAFDHVLATGPYEISAHKVDDYMAGVSTLDLVQIQRHLLNIETFDRPEQFIAADANRSQTVSAIDLVELRKLILGIYEALPNNESWRFGTPDLTSLEINPWYLNESLIIDHLDQDLERLSFTGIKIGDVNGSWHHLSEDSNIESRSHDQYVLEFEDRELVDGQHFALDFYLNNQEALYGLQIALNLTNFDFVGIRSGRLDVTESFVQIENELRLNPISAAGVRGSKEGVLFRLTLVAKRSGKLSELLSISTDVLQPEAYINEEIKVVDLSIHQKKRSVSQTFDLIIAPNPVDSESRVYFENDSAERVTFELIDISGRIVQTTALELNKGNQSLSMQNLFTMTEFGVYILRVISGNQISSERFVYVH